MSEFKFGPLQEQWLQSLEQNPDRQLTGSLGRKELDGSYRACCLGELGLITDKCEWSGNFLIVKDDSDNVPSTIILRNVHEDLGLNSESGLSITDNILSLSHMNDKGKTWPEIAAIVRTNPTSYFNKSY